MLTQRGELGPLVLVLAPPWEVASSATVRSMQSSQAQPLKHCDDVERLRWRASPSMTPKGIHSLRGLLQPIAIGMRDLEPCTTVWLIGPASSQTLEIKAKGSV